MNLPDALEEIEVPNYFSPSNVVLDGGCELKSLLGNIIVEEKLLSHPKAVLGGVLHGFLESVSKLKLAHDEVLQEVLVSELGKVLENARESLLEDPRTAHYADLVSTMTRLEWSKTKRKILDMAYRLSASQPNKGVGRLIRPAIRSFGDTPYTGRFHEIPICSDALRLKGRMDCIEKFPGTLVIRDLKTGEIMDGEGHIFDHIKNQLKLYGLMVSEIDKTGRQIRLYVDSDAEYEIPFDSESARHIRELVCSFIERFPKGKLLKAKNLTSPGESCQYCLYRHICTSYLDFAQSNWKSPLDFVLPRDIWGNVTKIEYRTDNNMMSLIDDAGRNVKIFGLRDSMMTQVKPDMKVWFFGLSASSSFADNDRYIHPINFYENDRTGAVKRAWPVNMYINC